MPVYVSLLRGINVGGNKKIKMADLKELYASIGFEDAKTLLQSGNVVFSTGKASARSLSKRIEDAIQERYGFDVHVITRTLDEIRAIVNDHPFSDAQINDPAKILVYSLEDAPSKEAVNALQEAHSGPEEMHFAGNTLYIFYPDGMGRSKLSNTVIERKLKIQGTGRNWNTLNKIIALGEEF